MLRPCASRQVLLGEPCPYSIAGLRGAVGSRVFEGFARSLQVLLGEPCTYSIAGLRGAAGYRVFEGFARSLQVLLGEPCTYSIADLRDATGLAQKIVSSYGMTATGITMYAPKQPPIGFMKRAFEVRARQKNSTFHAHLLQHPGAHARRAAGGSGRTLGSRLVRGVTCCAQTFGCTL